MSKKDNKEQLKQERDQAVIDAVRYRDDMYAAGVNLRHLIRYELTAVIEEVERPRRFLWFFKRRSGVAFDLRKLRSDLERIADKLDG